MKALESRQLFVAFSFCMVSVVVFSAAPTENCIMEVSDPISFYFFSFHKASWPSLRENVLSSHCPLYTITGIYAFQTPYQFSNVLFMGGDPVASLLSKTLNFILYFSWNFSFGRYQSICLAASIQNVFWNLINPEHATWFVCSNK